MTKNHTLRVLMAGIFIVSGLMAFTIQDSLNDEEAKVEGIWVTEEGYNHRWVYTLDKNVKSTKMVCSGKLTTTL